MDGTRAFGEWTGGWLGVLNEQAEDVNELIGEWIGDSYPIVLTNSKGDSNGY